MLDLLTPCRDRAARPGPAARRPRAACRSARTRRSGCRRADTSSRRSEASVGFKRLDHVLADPHRAILVEGAVVAELAEIELQRLGLDQPLVRRVVDHQMGEVGLAGDRAERGEFRRGEAGDIIRVAVRVRRPVEGFCVRRLGNARGFAEMGEGCGFLAHRPIRTAGVAPARDRWAGDSAGGLARASSREDDAASTTAGGRGRAWRISSSATPAATGTGPSGWAQSYNII